MLTEANRTTKYNCENCLFYSNDKALYNRHISTKKHISTLPLEQQQEICFEVAEYECNECGLKYKHQSSYSKHKKTCGIKKENKEINEIIIEDLKKQLEEQKRLYEERIQDLKNQLQQQHSLINLLVVQNQNQQLQQPQQPQQLQQLQQPFIIQLPQKLPQTPKPKFCLKRFLNETCKDAINIKKFKESIIVTDNDVEMVEDQKLQVAISKLIIKHFKDETTRPFYVSNLQEKIIWVKNENDEWVENTDKKLIKNLINTITFKYIELSLKLKQKHKPAREKENVIPKYEALELKILRDSSDIDDNFNLVYNYLFPLLKINKEKYVYDDNENLEMKHQ